MEIDEEEREDEEQEPEQPPTLGVSVGDAVATEDRPG